MRARHLESSGASPGQFSIGIQLPATGIGPGDVVDLLVGVALFVQPALDDLDAVKVAAEWVLEGAYQERRGFAFGRPSASDMMLGALSNIMVNKPMLSEWSATTRKSSGLESLTLYPPAQG